MLTIGVALGLAACGGGQAPAVAADPAPAPSAAASAEAPAVTSFTPARCEAAGGKVVGDIGDGAIHRPDYRCASGSAPLGGVASEPGQPVAIEGAVCCP